MKIPEIGEGVCLGIGGTNYRIAEIDAMGDVVSSYQTPTPNSPAEFFGQAARVILEAADRGATWSVMGAPGPAEVTWDADDVVAQNVRVTNIPALSRDEGFDPIAEMANADPAAGRLLESDDFTHVTTNDGKLAVLAGAKLFGSSYTDVGDVIVGSGIGGDLARRDDRFPGAAVYHPDQGLWEIGHNSISTAFPSLTYEKGFSGPALAALRSVADAKDIRKDDPVWQEVGHAIGDLALILAINGGAKLVVPSGGIGVREQKQYKDGLQRTLDDFANSSNPMADKVPDIAFVDEDMADTYEMYGAQGAIISHLLLREIDRRVRAD